MSEAGGRVDAKRRRRAARVLSVVVAVVLGVLTLGTRTSLAVEFCNTTPIIGNGGAPAPNVSNPYPSSITVSGLTGTVTDVNVRLLDINTRPDGGGEHWAEDLDVLLVAPDGSNTVLMSDAGGDNNISSGPVTNVNLTFDQQAANPLPADTALFTGTFRPVNDSDVDPQINPDDQWPSPAPAPSGTADLNTFNGTNPNGTWNLFVVDDYGQAAVDINGGWCIDILTSVNGTTTSTTAGTTTSTSSTTSTSTTLPPTTTSTSTTLPPTTTSTSTTLPPTTTSTSTTTTLPPTTTSSTLPPTTSTSTTSTTVPSGLLCDGRTPTLVGTPGPDRLVGTAGPDVIMGLGGDDQIVGLGGDDVICGGAGSDQISGGAGNDRLFGDAGTDVLMGDDGDDTLNGGADTDQCHGGAGAGDVAILCEATSGIP